MESLVKISGYNNLAKDVKNGGVVNIDKKSYEQHLTAKNMAKLRMQEQVATKESISNLQQDVEKLKEDISSIKDMLTQLIGNSK